MNLLDEDHKLRELPCFIIAMMIHGLFWSTPILTWKGAPKAPAALSVDFVTEVPKPPEPMPKWEPPVPLKIGGPKPKPQKNTAPAGERPKPKARLRSVVPQKGKTPPAHVKQAPLVPKRAVDPAAAQAAARKKAELVAIAEENDRIRRKNAEAAATALNALKERRRQEALALREEQERAAAAARAFEQQRREARARRKAGASRALARMTDPDESLSDAVADVPTGNAAGAASATTRAAAFRAGKEEVYEMEPEGKGGPDAKGGGGTGGSAWSLEGPAGGRRVVRKVLPESPEWLRQRGLELTVRVKFTVRPDGGVRPGAVIKKTSGFPEVDERAIDALSRWKFDAAEGPDAWGIVTFRFLLD